ncbi:Ig-like domain-containing protein, partial [Rhizosaccharibacter radicis]|nr:Ig-like domain-containing protein [Acetobacteraceae bacterium KSS12]
ASFNINVPSDGYMLPSVGSVVTSASTLHLQGMADPGQTLTITASGSDKTLVVGTAKANGHGMWSLDSSNVLTSGYYKISASTTDAFGRIVSSVATQEFIVDEQHIKIDPKTDQVIELSTFSQKNMSFIIDNSVLSAGQGDSIHEYGTGNTIVMAENSNITYDNENPFGFDYFDISNCLKMAGWDGRASSMGQYISTSIPAGSSSTVIKISDGSSGGSSITFNGITDMNADTFIRHCILHQS